MGVDRCAVLTILREKILSGEFAAGTRIAEIPTSQALGVSRTPVRIAFRALEQQGLLDKLPGRGYRVREFSHDEIAGAMLVRIELEGLAVRLAAEKGLSPAMRSQLKQHLKHGDNLLHEGSLNEQLLHSFVKMNRALHNGIAKASGNGTIINALKLNEYLPVASLSTLMYNPTQAEREFRRLQLAHEQHHAIVEAIIAGQVERAEVLMKEHVKEVLQHFERGNNETPQQTIRISTTRP